MLPYETAKAIESVRGSATAEVADDGASAKANIGDVINYRVQVGPIWTTGYDAGRTLKASDSLNAGQTFDISSVKAYTYDAPADGGALTRPPSRPRPRQGRQGREPHRLGP